MDWEQREPKRYLVLSFPEHVGGWKGVKIKHDIGFGMHAPCILRQINSGIVVATIEEQRWVTEQVSF
jgi:hypothetical protein